MRLVAAGLGWTWPDGSEGTGPVDLSLDGGRLVLLTGPSGGGKSTLLRLLSGQLRGAGRTGRVTLDGVDLAAVDGPQRVTRVGMVGQVPSDQLLAGTVYDELAFGLEGAGAEPALIDRRVRAEVGRLGLAPDRSTEALSGGQQQRLITAAARVCAARLLLLDEPLAWLDEAGSAELVAALRALADEGALVIVAEHRTDKLRPLADIELRLEAGRLVGGGDAAEVGVTAGRSPGDVAEVSLGSRESSVELHLRPVRRGPWSLDVPCWTWRPGEQVALVGPNGAGKSTLLASLQEAARGRVRTVRLPQDPDLALFSATVRDEIAWAMDEKETGLTASLAASLGVAHLLDRAPHALSRGERLRVAVAAALAARPAWLLLDEPTAGQDPEHAQAILAALREAGVSALVATHDPRVVAWADRSVRLNGGQIDGVEGPSPQGDPSSRSGLDPRVRLTLLACLSTWVLLVDQPVSLTLITALAVVALWRAPAVPKLPVLGAMLGLGWSTAIGQALFRDLPGQTVLLRVGPVELWWEGFLHGLVQSLRIAAISLGGLALVGTTPPDRLLLGLRGLGVPWAAAFLASSALRVVPRLGASWAQVREAQAARTPGAGRGWRRARAELDALRPLIARAVRHAAVLAESLVARGFSPAAPRTVARPLRAGVGEVALAGAAVALTLAGVAARVLFLLYTSGLWYAPALRPLYALVRGWM